jgi:hypothetical protein
MTDPLNQLILTDGSISKSPNSCVDSLLHSFFQFSFTLIRPNIHIKYFLAIADSR